MFIIIILKKVFSTSKIKKILYLLTFNKSSSRSSTDSEAMPSDLLRTFCSLSESSFLLPVVLKPLNFNSLFKSCTYNTLNLNLWEIVSTDKGLSWNYLTLGNTERKNNRYILLPTFNLEISIKDISDISVSSAIFLNKIIQ